MPPPDREVFFLGEGAERRFCLATRPAGAPRGALLHVHPFAEELNRSRRMTALAAQAFAQAGWLVLQIDAHGCGDSEGDFGDASWQGWQHDLARGHAWLRQHCDGAVTLWTLRAGSLLAASWLAAGGPAAPLLCWQPVLNGKTYLTQFLRIRLAGELAEDPGSRSLMAGLRASLQAGRPVTVAGYVLAPALAQGLEAASFTLPDGHAAPVTLLELAPAERPQPSPALATLAARWQAAGLRCVADTAPGPKFWQSAEIETAPALIERSLAALEAHCR